MLEIGHNTVTLAKNGAYIQLHLLEIVHSTCRGSFGPFVALEVYGPRRDGVPVYEEMPSPHIQTARNPFAGGTPRDNAVLQLPQVVEAGRTGTPRGTFPVSGVLRDAVNTSA